LLTPAFRRPRRALTGSTKLDATLNVYKRAIILKLPRAVGVACKALILIMDIRSGHGPRLSQDTMR